MELAYAAAGDIDGWMELVTRVRDSFPGLETAEGLADYQGTLLRFMEKRQAICVKAGGAIIGVMLFSRRRSMICCLAVAPEYRRRGVASRLMGEALGQLGRPVTVTTFRAGDAKGAAPRAFYKKFGFQAGKLMEEHQYPVQQYILAPDAAPEAGKA